MALLGIISMVRRDLVKNWLVFLIWFVFFLGLDIVSETMKYCIVTDRWFLACIGLVFLILCWVWVFLRIDLLQTKDTQKNKRKKKFLTFGIWFVYLGSLFMTFDIMKYLVENSVMNKWYFLIIGFVCIFLGWFGARLDMKCFNKKK